MTTQNSETGFKLILIPNLLLYLQKHVFLLTASNHKYTQSRKEDAMYVTFCFVPFLKLKGHLPQQKRSIPYEVTLELNSCYFRNEKRTLWVKSVL